MSFFAKARLPQWIDHIQPSETAVLIGTAITVGLGTGLGAVIFIRLIALVQKVFFEGGENKFGWLGRGLFILIPTLGGLIAGPVISFFAKEAKGHGVPEVMQAIALRGGRIRPRVVVAKVVASALCIGSGGSAGREGPIVQVGAALGSTLAQWLHLSEGRIRNLVACGAAAGIAATFNAPIAGVVFAMEIILGELHIGDLGNVVISSVTASWIATHFLGSRPAFEVPNYSMHSTWEILLYAGLGILAALVAVFFIVSLYWFEDRFDQWHFPDALKPAVGGLLLGSLAFFYPMVLGLGFVPEEEALLGLPLSANIPHVFGSGFPVIESTLLGTVSFSLLFVLMLLKPLATSLTLGSGNSGGVFAPALFTGGALGGAFGLVVEKLLPGATAGPGAFATVGMAAVFAGAARAPFTAILIVFEMTDDYRLILPLMAAVIVSLIVSERLHKESIYTLKLARRGIRLQSGRDVEVLETLTVEEVMNKMPDTLLCTDSVAHASEVLLRTRHHGVPVVTREGKLAGVLTLQDLDRTHSEDWTALTIEDVCTREPVTAFPDETIGTALRRMSTRDIGRLPVVSRENPEKLVGLLRRVDLVRAYDLALTRRAAMHHRVHQARLGATSGEDVLVDEILVETGAPCEGKRVSEVNWPRSCILASLRRGSQVILPHGDTLLLSGDVLVAVVKGDAHEQIHILCQHAEPEPEVETEPETQPVDSPAEVRKGSNGK